MILSLATLIWKGGGLDVRPCDIGRHTVTLKGDGGPCLQNNPEEKLDTDKEVDADEEVDADVEPPDDAIVDKAVGGESYDQYSDTLSEPVTKCACPTISPRSLTTASPASATQLQFIYQDTPAVNTP